MLIGEYHRTWDSVSLIPFLVVDPACAGTLLAFLCSRLLLHVGQSPYRRQDMHSVLVWGLALDLLMRSTLFITIIVRWPVY